MCDWREGLCTFWWSYSQVAIEIYEEFLRLDQVWKPVAIVAFLLCVSLIKFAFAVWSADITDLIGGDETDGRAPRGYPVAPKIFSPPKRWLVHYIACFYIRRCRPIGIGWFAPWLLTWVACAGIALTALLSLPEWLGFDAIRKADFIVVFSTILLAGLVIAYAHNEGRLKGKNNKIKHVPFHAFMAIFAKPLVATILTVALIQNAPKPLTFAWKTLSLMGSIG